MSRDLLACTLDSDAYYLFMALASYILFVHLQLFMHSGWPSLTPFLGRSRAGVVRKYKGPRLQISISLRIKLHHLCPSSHDSFTPLVSSWGSWQSWTLQSWKLNLR